MTGRRRFLPHVTVIGLAALLSGCGAHRRARTVPDRPASPLPMTYARNLATATGSSFANTPWFTVFGDEALQALIRSALAYNTDVRLAAARVLESRAILGIARGDERPSVTATASAGGQRTPAVGSSDARTAAALSVQGAASWEIDFWGRIRSTTDAARARLVSAEWSQRAVVSGLVSDVATRYFTARALDAQLDIAQRTLTSRRASLELARIRETGGATSMLDVRQAEQLVYGATSAIADLERRVAIEEHALAVLVADPAAAVPRGRPLASQSHAPEVPAGLPSDLLTRRPDIVQAEQNVVASEADLLAARAALFPRIALTGTGGLLSTALTSLVSGGAGLWSAIASATQPVFNNGRLKSQVALADARRQEALLAYENTVRRAFQDVADALVDYRQLRELRMQQALLLDASRDARRLADIRYQGGATSYLEVLDADTRLFQAELGVAQAQLGELNAFVDVYRALGGGWQ